MSEGWLEGNLACDLPDPEKERGRWVSEFANALEDIASEVGAIEGYDAAGQLHTAAALDGKDRMDPRTETALRLTKIKSHHNANGQEGKEGARWCEKVLRKEMSGNQWLRGECELIFEDWPATIHKARGLSQACARTEGLGRSVGEAATLVRQALACLEIVTSKGLKLMQEWQETCRIGEFSDDNAFQDILGAAAVFGGALREHDVRVRLEEIASHLRTHVQMGTPMPEAGEKDKLCPHSPDFRSLNWFGTEYGFTPYQAPCVRIWYQRWKTPARDVSDETVLEAAECESKRVSDLFKRHPAWNNMIVAGATRGTHRLREPSEGLLPKPRTQRKRKRGTKK